ncbi:putative GTPase ArgK [compost metagenome]
MAESVIDYAARVKAGDRRALARLITLLENRHPQAMQAVSQLYADTGRAWLLGITGPPGAGKSSLVDLLVTAIRREGLSVAVVAIDPSSPFSGGAILGDRIRMKSHASDAGVFIRSMSSRGHLGGLSLATKAACRVLDAAGFDVIIVETVGVGQSEVEIAQAADTTLLVMPPNLGDGIQAIKAGIMEVPDLFVINKADLPGSQAAANEIRSALSLEHPGDWDPPVLLTESTAPSFEASHLQEVWEAIRRHRAYLEVSGELVRRRAVTLREEVFQEALGRLLDMTRQEVASPFFEPVAQELLERRIDPQEAAERLLGRLVACLSPGPQA